VEPRRLTSRRKLWAAFLTVVMAISATPAPAATNDAAEAAGKEPVVVLDADFRLVPQVRELGMTIPARIARLLSQFSGISPLTSDDLRALSELEARRQEIGCDTSSCLAELASAFGARFVVGTQFTREGRNTRMTFSLIDTKDASIVSRGTVSGTESELIAQLPFALDAAITSLRRPDDPPIGAMLSERMQLAVLPVRLVGLPAALAGPARATVAGAAAELASRMQLSLADENATTALTTAAGCAAADLRCALPAAASRGAKLGLAVSVVGGARVVVRATLLRPDSSVEGEAERTANASTEDAVVASIADAVLSAAGRPGAATRGPPSETVRAPPAPVLSPVPLKNTPVGSDRVRDIVDDDEIDGDAVEAKEERVGIKKKAAKNKPVTFPCLLTADGVTLGGRCGVSDGRFRFVTLSSSAKGATVDIALTDIKEARARPSDGIDNGVEMVLNDGARISFQVEVKVRDRLLRAIKRGSQR
jgi:hypothetical protein